MNFIILRPFWHRAGPVAEQSRAEPSRAGPSRAGPSRAGPGRAEPSRAKPRRSEPGRAEPEPSRAEMSPKAVFCHRRAPKSIQKPVPPKPEINQNVPNMPKLLPNGLSHLFLFKTPVFFFHGVGMPKRWVHRAGVNWPPPYIYRRLRGIIREICFGFVSCSCRACVRAGEAKLRGRVRRVSPQRWGLEWQHFRRRLRRSC